MKQTGVGILFLILSLGSCLAGGKPNVILIMPDDLSYGDFSFYSPEGPRTPNIDSLARNGVRLTDFHVSLSCSPTRATVMTGRSCEAAGVWHTILGRYYMRTNEVTMADVFRANGYRTALFGKWHLGDSYLYRPKDRGFEHVVMLKGGGIDQQFNPWGNRNTVPCTIFENDRPVQLSDENGTLPGFRPAAGRSGAFSSNYFTTEAINYMKARLSREEPFFVYLPYNVAHAPNDMPPDARPGVDAHTATIENLDKNVGRVLSFLDSSGLSENTILMFFTDNGEDSPLLRSGKCSEYEGGHRVPCFIRWPAGGYGGTHDGAREMARMADAMDLLPTFMDVLGLQDVPQRPPGVPLEGRSLKTLLDTDPANDDPALGGRVLVVDNQRLDDLVKYKQACVMRDELDANGAVVHKWRLIRTSATQPWELYDIQADILQRTNLLQQAGTEPLQSVVHSLEAAYETWWRKVSMHASEYSRPIVGSPAEPVLCLYSHDWHVPEGCPPWNQAMVAAGLAGNGFSSVVVDGAGDYTFDLRRWPLEIADETTVDSGLRTPLRINEGNATTRGRALPIRAARIRIWNGNQTYADERQAVKPGASGAVFTLSLPAGPAMVQTWFYDAAGQELCGAYYVYVRRK